MKNNEIAVTIVNLIIAAFFATLFVLIFFFPAEFGKLLNTIIEQIK